MATTRPRAGRREKDRARISVRLKIRAPSTSTTKGTTGTGTTDTTPGSPAPTLTPTYLAATSLDLDGETASDPPTTTAYFDIDTTLNYLTDSGSLQYLVGSPVTYTLVDQVTGATVTSFSGTTTTGIGAVQGCAIGYSIDSGKTTLTLTGESINPETGDPLLPACFSGTLTVPYGDPIALDASFAGNSTYAASTDSQPDL